MPPWLPLRCDAVPVQHPYKRFCSTQRTTHDEHTVSSHVRTDEHSDRSEENGFPRNEPATDVSCPYASSLPMSIQTTHSFPLLGWPTCCRLPLLPCAGAKLKKVKSKLFGQPIFWCRCPTITITSTVASESEAHRQHCTLQLSVDDGHLGDSQLCRLNLDMTLPPRLCRN